jgi:adenine-specific DNA-methyltransferase
MRSTQRILLPIRSTNSPTLYSASISATIHTCAILNPPYRKIQSTSAARQALRRAGIETSNLYTGFLALAIYLLLPQGELVAITPRSFCNGLYFRPFRAFLLEHMALRQFHLFDSRENAFRDNAVLQENIIFSAVKSKQRPTSIIVGSSMDSDDDMPMMRHLAYDRVVHPGDPEHFLHLVSDALGEQVATRIAQFTATLADLGLTISTGRVVDFRAAPFLRANPEADTAPLIYPTHVSTNGITWPKSGIKKPNALVYCEATRSLFVPNEHYVLVKRFSAKEERRRVAAAVYDPSAAPGVVVGFENHLNYFTRMAGGLTSQLPAD